jgi:hypothetical protein
MPKISTIPMTLAAKFRSSGPETYPAGWVPSDDPDCFKWYDFANSADLTLDGSEITAVADRIGTDDLGGVAGKYPTLVEDVINGRQVARFDGVDNYLSADWTSFNPAAAGMTMYIVGVKRDADAADSYITDGSDATHRHLVYYKNTDFMTVYRGTAERYTTAQVMTKDTPFVMTVRVKTDSVVAVVVNGTYELLPGGAPGTHWNDGIVLASIHDKSLFGEVDLAEVIIVKDDTFGELNDNYNAYFLARWGIDNS